MDQFDRATELEEMHREAALTHRKPVPDRDGKCLNCDEPSEGAFCDVDCQQDAKRRGIE